jgi:DNA replication licensing factor MCM5
LFGVSFRVPTIAAMSGFDANVVHSVPILADKPPGTTLESASDTERMLLDFLLQYRVGGVFLYRSVILNSPSKAHLQLHCHFIIKRLLCHNYRDQLRANLLLRIDSLEVELRHVALYNDDLAHAIQDRPGDTLPLFELAAAKAAKKILYPIAAAAGEDGEIENREVQIMIKSTMNMLQFRDLTVRSFLPPTCKLLTVEFP